jgi:hypothetical protein
VLYILGKGRAGSTLLDNVLGQLDGFVSVGELLHLWDWGLVNGWSCGCGTPIPKCHLWSQVLEVAFGNSIRDPATARSVLDAQRAVLSWRRLPFLLRCAGQGRIGNWPALQRYCEVLSNVYLALREVTGRSVIVDSSKWPASPTPLGLVPGIDVYVVQLVRDPRAVVFAWKKHKVWTDRPGRQSMPRFGSAYSLGSWWARTVTSELVRRNAGRDRQALIRYEDFIEHPRQTLHTITSLVGAHPDLPLVADDTVHLAPTHSVGGNPVRLSTGRVALSLDDEWMREQSTADTVAATLATLPFLRRYGYPLRRRQPFGSLAVTPRS